MNDVQDLISACVEKLHVYEDRTLVGNRPHYPMCVMYNEAFSADSINNVYNRLKRFWPSTVNHELFYRYYYNEALCFEKYSNEKDDLVHADREDIEESVRNTSTQKDIHEDLMRWLLINVIDTKGMKSAAEFEKQYVTISDLKETIACSTKSILTIILRDEKSKGEDTAYHIREFLKADYEKDTPPVYDAVIIISDLRIDNARLCNEELLSLLADIMLIADNDAVSELDDDDYISRSKIFSQGNIYTVGYKHLERPNENIAKQICDILVDAAKEDAYRTISDTDFRNCMGIVNSRIKSVEDIIDKLSGNECDFIYSLPMVKEAVKECDFGRLPFYEIKNYLSDRSVIDIIAESETDGAVVNDCVKMIVKKLKTLPLAYWEETGAGCINGNPVTSLLDTGMANEQLDFTGYYNSLLCEKIRTEVYKEIPGILAQMKEKAEYTRNELEKVSEGIDNIRPVGGYTNLGSKYKNITEDFIRSQITEADSAIHGIVMSGNSKEQILDRIKSCFDRIIEDNKDSVFSKTFSEEWEMRLQQTSDMIYEKIKAELAGIEGDDICLLGDYPRSVELSVYMLHSTDESGSDETGLYRYLKAALTNYQNVQYLNTGFDDELDAISFIKLYPKDLIRACS